MADLSNPRPNRFSGYYIGFDSTGVEPVDVILSAVARGGKAYHHTDGWNEEIHPYEPEFRGKTVSEWIQNAANDAAFELQRLRAALEEIQSGVYATGRSPRDIAHRVLKGETPVALCDALLRVGEELKP